MKYRITSHTQGENKWFHIEKKTLWWWSYYEEEDIDMLGMGASYPRKFSTFEEARKFIMNYLVPPTKEICKEYHSLTLNSWSSPYWYFRYTCNDCGRHWKVDCFDNSPNWVEQFNFCKKGCKINECCPDCTL